MESVATTIRTVDSVPSLATPAARGQKPGSTHFRTPHTSCKVCDANGTWINPLSHLPTGSIGAFSTVSGLRAVVRNRRRRAR